MGAYEQGVQDWCCENCMILWLQMPTWELMNMWLLCHTSHGEHDLDLPAWLQSQQMWSRAQMLKCTGEEEHSQLEMLHLSHQRQHQH
jgi:hypothetical protein